MKVLAFTPFRVTVTATGSAVLECALSPCEFASTATAPLLAQRLSGESRLGTGAGRSGGAAVETSAPGTESAFSIRRTRTTGPDKPKWANKSDPRFCASV